MLKKLLCSVLFFVSIVTFAQEDAWVYFNDKPDTAYYLANPLQMLSQRALDRRTAQGIGLDETDVPVSIAYVNQVAAAIGITVMAQSKWMNAVHVRGTQADIQALIDQARLQRPDLLATESELKASLAKIESAKADAKPKVKIDASNQYDTDTIFGGNINFSQIGVSVTIPFFEGYKPSYLIRSAEATAELKASKRDQLKLQVSLDVWTAYQNLKTANESIKASQILLTSAEESSQVALGRYESDTGRLGLRHLRFAWLVLWWMTGIEICPHIL